MSEVEPQAPPTFQVRYFDAALGYEWFATFATSDEALDQAAMQVVMYGDITAQEVLDGRGAVVYDQAAIIAASEELPG